MDGIINIDKPGGVTSHDVVREVRGVFPGVKVGHSGTLDPLAEGVLPLCLGRATRVVEYIMAQRKTYRAEVVLGIMTETDDAAGTVLRRAAVPRLERDEVEGILRKFSGTITQKPPLYSAVKHRGKPLYYWARRGEEAPRRERSVTIYRLEMSDFQADRAPHLTLRVECSKGFYIRTLAADIGQAIGCGAHLHALVRTAVGPFRLENAVSPAEVATLAEKGAFAEFLLPVDAALNCYPALQLDATNILALKHGRTVVYESSPLPGQADCIPVLRVYDGNACFKALARLKRDGAVYKLTTVKYLSD